MVVVCFLMILTSCLHAIIILIEYETAHRRIMSYSWPGVQEARTGEGTSDGIEKEREVRISSIIPMDSSNMVSFYTLQ